MNNRERIINTVLCKEVDRLPLTFFFPPWDETLERWHCEGLNKDSDWRVELDLDPGFEVIDTKMNLMKVVNLNFNPGFKRIILEEKENTRIVRDQFGVVLEENKKSWTLPRFIKNPVENRKDWEELKAHRLNSHDSGRFPKNWSEVVRHFNQSETVAQIGFYPNGLFGFARELMGVEGLLIKFYDDPGLIKDIMDYMTDFWITIYEKICKDIRVDCIHMWEDMSGKNGSLISPEMVRKFMMTNYKKIKAFADGHDIKIFSMDTDGDVSELIPLFMECGINLVFPFEVAAGCDIVEYRMKYHNLGIMGGIDKREIAKGKVAIDRELERISEVFKHSGYIAALDHLPHPEISWEDFKYFTKRLHEIIGA